MTIKEIITPEPLCITPDATLLEAAEEMKSMDVGILLICENDRIVGTITDRDITVRAIAEGCDPKTTKVCEVMNSETKIAGRVLAHISMPAYVTQSIPRMTALGIFCSHHFSTHF